MKTKLVALITALSGTPCLLHGQFDFKVLDRSVQVHSFASQGFAYSNQNNYLTMNTSSGSFSMTDGGANISTNITDKFRVGAQLYIRNIGHLGNYRPDIDWALGDYKFASWLGLRAGKVKTTLGLYNDTQDLEFLHTWAILPQSAYSLDLRASTIAHVGGDLYGTVAIKHLGSFSYTGYAGSTPDDKNGGYRYGLQGLSIEPTGISGFQIGGDVRWNTPLKGLLVVASYVTLPEGVAATTKVAANLTFPANIDALERATVYDGEYKTGGLTVAGEYRRQFRTGDLNIGPLPARQIGTDTRSWYASGAYRVSRRLEVGTYHSRFYPDWSMPYHGGPDGHIFDQTVTARVDLNTHWDLKIEEHFIDGHGSQTSFRGFYGQNNPMGFKPQTKMFVVRTGWNF